MVVTINNIQVQFGLEPPLITFLQGADMSVPSIRNTLRLIEATPEGRSQQFNRIVAASGNEDFTENQDGSIKSALTLKILSPYVCCFEPGEVAFSTSGGNILFTGVDSPGAIVKINNAIGAFIVTSSEGGTPGLTPSQEAMLLELYQNSKSRLKGASWSC